MFPGCFLWTLRNVMARARCRLDIQWLVMFHRPSRTDSGQDCRKHLASGVSAGGCAAAGVPEAAVLRTSPSSHLLKFKLFGSEVSKTSHHHPGGRGYHVHSIHFASGGVIPRVSCLHSIIARASHSKVCSNRPTEAGKTIPQGKTSSDQPECRSRNPHLPRVTAHAPHPLLVTATQAPAFILSADA